MTLFRVASGVVLAGALLFSVSCSESDDTSIEEMTPEREAEIQQLQEQYTGSGGQHSPGASSGPPSSDSAPTTN
jgi:hypothetical protein